MAAITTSTGTITNSTGDPATTGTGSGNGTGMETHAQPASSKSSFAQPSPLTTHALSTTTNDHDYQHDHDRAPGYTQDEAHKLNSHINRNSDLRNPSNAPALTPSADRTSASSALPARPSKLHHADPTPVSLDPTSPDETAFGQDTAIEQLSPTKRNFNPLDETRPLTHNPSVGRRDESCAPASPPPAPVVSSPSVQARPRYSLDSSAPRNDHFRASGAAIPVEETNSSATSLACSKEDTTKLKRSQSSDAAVTSATRGTILTSRNSGSNATVGQQAAAVDPPVSRTRESSVGAESLPDRSSRDSLHHQRELILPKTVSQTSPNDEKRLSHRPPPVSFKAPNVPSSQSGPSTPVRVPPIRGFRSSGSRKSLTLDLGFKSRPLDYTEATPDPNYDHTLRALEGRQDQDLGQMTPPTSARHPRADGDDHGDVFLKIAREEPSRRATEDYSYNADEDRSDFSRTLRPSHRRPLSTAHATYQPTSPPPMRRRLSDQQDTTPYRRHDDQSSELSRTLTYRSSARDKAASAHPGEDSGRSRYSTSVLRPSPLTPRSVVGQDQEAEETWQSRRRPSVNESNSGTPASRGHTHRSHGSGQVYGKSYNSSPLTRSFDLHGHHATEAHHGVEGTDSTTSNAAPSTVWDELDDLKSRINRLELTGKLPSTSGAAVSRLSDERPPTATTTATTMSSSPKRSGGGVAVSHAPVGAQATEGGSATSSQKEAHPILHSALTKSKPFLNQEVFRALECAANDAMALSSMMGTPGHPGPISSGASTIGSGTTITDRQLRRKADGVCRNLTELCIALGEEVVQAKTAPPAADQQQQDSHTQPQRLRAQHGDEHTDNTNTPTMVKSYSGLPTQRRQSLAAADQSLSQSNSSPKVMSKFEERRNHILTGSSLPSPRGAQSTPSTPNDNTSSRRSSLLISRTRRATTEEPEEIQASSYLRGRRAGTEEPEEGRRTSLLVRHRRGTVGDGDGRDSATFRAPSRATTEIHTARDRGSAREYHPRAQVVTHEEPASVQSSSALPRRRFVSTNTNSSRLAMPGSVAGAAAPTRRYLERSIEREGQAPPESNPPVVERGHQRYVSQGQTRLPERAASISTRRQNRDSTITLASTAATAGSYR